MKLAKRLFSLLLTLALLMTCVPQITLTASAAELTSDLQWAMDGTTLTISGTGEIPTMDYYPWADYKYEIEKVVIDDGVENVPYAAFQGYTNLTEVELGDTVAAIGSWAFYGTGLGAVALPASVESIGDYAFQNCSALESVDLGKVKTIGSDVGGCVFAGCTALVNVTIPKTVTYIAANTFDGCAKLKRIDFKGTAPKIGDNAFKGVTATAYYDNDTAWVEAVKKTYGGTITWTILNCTHSYGDWVKLDNDTHQRVCTLCQNPEGGDHDYVAKVTDPTCEKDGYTTYTCSVCKDSYVDDEVETEGHAYTGWVKVDEKTHKRGCNACETFSETAPHAWDDGVVTEPTVGVPGYTTYTCAGCGFSKVEEQNNYLASGNCGTNDKKDNVKWALDVNGTLIISGTGKMAAYDMDENWAPWLVCGYNVKKVVVEKGVTNIGAYAFAGMGELVNITFADSVTAIDEGAFCFASLTEVELPKSLKTIGEYAFYQSSLTEVEIPDSVTVIGEYAFNTCYNLQTLKLGKGVVTIGDNAFVNCRSVTEVEIPDSVTVIGDFAFLNCMGLTELKLGKGVTTIGEGAFQVCVMLTEVELPDSVTTIGAGAFQECYNLQTVKLPKNLETISEKLFSNCHNLTEIEIPNSVTSIELEAFANTGLIELIIPDSVKTIGYYAFKYSNLNSVDIGTGVTTIKMNAFEGCYNLRNVWFLGSAPKMENNAFYEVEANAYYYADNTWTDGVKKNYGGYIQWEEAEKDPAGETSGRCGDSLTWKLENGVLTISGIGGMYDYTRQTPAPWYSERNSVKQVILQDGVANIGAGAFEDCVNLTGIEMADTVVHVGAGAFDGCKKMVVVMYTGIMDDAGYVVVEERNDAFNAANIHFEVTLMPGQKLIYKCAVCELYFRIDDGKAELFTDVATSSWQYDFATYALARGFINGTGTDDYGRVKFDPNSNVTREQFVQMLYNAEGKPASSSSKVFQDVKDAWYKKAVYWAYENSIASGKGENFGIGESITRQDMAVMLYKYAKMKGHSLDAEKDIINKYADGSKVVSYAKTAMDWAVSNGIISGKGSGGNVATYRLDPTGAATRAECAAMLKNFMTAFGQ